MSATPICFNDTETDGVHPGRKPWEIALIRRDETGDHELQMFVEIDLRTADQFGLKIGGFYQRHPLGKWLADPRQDGTMRPVPGIDLFSRSAAANLVAQWTHGAHMVGAVPNFDTEVYSSLLREHGLCPSWHYHLIDVEALAVGYARQEGIEVPLPWQSDDLMAAIGVPVPSDEERHTALGDARWARAAYDAVMGGAA